MKKQMKECDRYAADKEVAANTPSCAPLAWGSMKYRHSVASTPCRLHCSAVIGFTPPPLRGTSPYLLRKQGRTPLIVSLTGQVMD